MNWIIQILKAFFTKSEMPEFQPKLRHQITYGEIYAMLRNLFPEAQLFISDSTKYLCDMEDIEAFLAQDKTNREKYQAESYDCDDFAYRLMGQFSVPGWASLAKALVWTDVHALNGFIDTNMEWWFIEPQQDTIKQSLSRWQGEKIRFIAI